MDNAQTHPETPSQSESLSQRETPSPHESPSRLAVNVYLLLGLLTLVWSSYAFQDSSAQYVIGIVIEMALAVGALIFMRLEKRTVPWRSIGGILRWRWPGWRLVGLSGALALGLWMIGVILNLITTVILGYTAPMPPSTFPRTIPEAFLLLVATVIAAPLCEELMFRGYVQRAYERRSPWTGIVVSGVIFTLYHLRFQGAMALAPVAFALGFVAWRSNSLFPGMLLHAAYNSIASAVLIASSFFSMPVVSGLVLSLACLSFFMVPVTAILLWFIWRWSTPPAKLALPRLTGWRAWAWIVPLVVMGNIYGISAYGEVLVGRFPEMLAVEKLALQPPSAWNAPAQWHYVIQTGLNETVGEANCDLAPQTNSVTLTCQVQQNAFEADLPINLPKNFEGISLPEYSATGAAFESAEHITWAKTDLSVQSMESRRESETAQLTLTQTTTDDGATLRVEGNGEIQTTMLPSGAFLDSDWPWRLSALPFDLAYGSTQPLVLVDRQGYVNIVDAFIVVASSEPAWTPAGNFVTWRVTVTYTLDGKEKTLSAWYDVDAPHTLVRYDNGEVSLLLDKVE
ncbi:MAG: CPBP family intramembrane metalloprotease [Anaerolineae bacterium]|nr:CPBP family intramembrane metalloprotease [Anaerolineae bacterium]